MTIPVGEMAVEGDLHIPTKPLGLVIFAHGSGSSRHSTRNQAVAAHLQQAQLATLLMDLLTAQEEIEERVTRHHRFNIELLATRLTAATELMQADERTAALPLGYFGASTGAAAALVAAARSGDTVRAVVSRGGRPDMAGSALAAVTSPTLLIVGGDDTVVISLNQDAMRQMHRAATLLEIIPGATHLFPEPGALDTVAELAAGWFADHLPAE